MKRNRLQAKIVHVVIDRPMNTYHPEHKEHFLSGKLGYIEGIIAPMTRSRMYMFWAWIIR